MKLVRYGQAGAEKPGFIDSQGKLRDLSAVVPDISAGVLAGGKLDSVISSSEDDFPLISGVPQKDIRLGPCVAGAEKFICIGLNYADHAKEAGMTLPAEPVVFGKWTSSISGPDDPVEIPENSTKTDWEVELAVIIGRKAKYISEDEAMNHVFGYCVTDDISEREFQLERSGTWDKGKGCDSFGPIGPWLVTKDEISDPHNLPIWLEIDGKRYQDSSTSQMVFKIPFVISYLSKFMSLHPGDIIATGTPYGVGMGLTPQQYLRPGMTMRLGIEGLGIQSHQVISAGQASGY